MRFTVVPAAYVLLRRGDEVLLQRRQNTGYMDGRWAVGAAGHVELGESVFEAAVHETAEELDVRVDPTDLIPLTTMHRTQDGHDPIDERVDFFFAVRRSAGEPRRVEPHKNAELRWWSLAARPEPMVPHEAWVLRGLLRDNLPAMVAVGFDAAADGQVRCD